MFPVVYIASDVSMRFHGVHCFHAFPYVSVPEDGSGLWSRDGP